MLTLMLQWCGLTVARKQTPYDLLDQFQADYGHDLPKLRKAKTEVMKVCFWPALPVSVLTAVGHDLPSGNVAVVLCIFSHYLALLSASCLAVTVTYKLLAAVGILPGISSQASSAHSVLYSLPSGGFRGC